MTYSLKFTKTRSGTIRHPVLAIALLSGCSVGGDFATGSKEDTKKTATSEQAGAESDNDTVDVPEIVSGAYLTCSDATAPAAGDLKYDCWLADKKNNQPIALAKIATKWLWRAVTPTSTTIKATVSESGDRNNAYYYFSGSNDGPTLQRFADATQIVLNVTLRRAVADVAFFSQSIKNARSNGSSTPVSTSANSLKSPAVVASGLKPTATGPDSDKDGIVDSDDMCQNTAAGGVVHQSGTWMGCAEGQFRAVDDFDADGVPNVSDLCSGTQAGIAVDKVAKSPTLGCSSMQVPEVTAEAAAQDDEE